MKKIMFSDKFGLTEAVLSGRKTQTRRIIKPQPEVSERMGMVWKGYAYGIASPAGSPSFLKDVYHNFLSGTNYPQCYRYKIGEVVAVAQSYKDAGIEPTRRIMQRVKGFELFPSYANVEIQYVAGWNNKLFVAPMLMPHHVRITNVRMERLQDISDEDCLAEGIEKVAECDDLYRVAVHHKSGRFSYLSGKTPREAYAALIDRMSGKGTWESNPYVFVYEFELVK